MTEEKTEKKLVEIASNEAEVNKESAEDKIIKNYGEFLPKGVDPVKVYKLWVNSIFGDQKVDSSTLYFILKQAQAMGIDPTIPKQIYAVGFNNKNYKTGETKMQYNIIVSIEAMVNIADSTGQYGGCTLPEYEFGKDKDGQINYQKVISCSIGVHKITQGVATTSYQKVFFDEYTTGKNLWKSKPKTMIKKVALAHALRATFASVKALNIAEEFERQEGSIVVEGVKTTSALMDEIREAKSLDEIQKIYDMMSPDEKKLAVDLVSQRLDELDV